jgi:dephospho-CoA kinase
MKSKVIVGLVGLRCCGKSTVRSILIDLGYPVFDTNSVRTGDSDANQISLTEVLRRYGKDESYMYFIEVSLREYISEHEGIIFIDSLKVATDLDVLRGMFPDHYIEIWYLHASTETRRLRYKQRDLDTKRRSESLEKHDSELEKHGIFDLIKAAKVAISMEGKLSEIRESIEQSIDSLNDRSNNSSL